LKKVRFDGKKAELATLHNTTNCGTFACTAVDLKRQQKLEQLDNFNMKANAASAPYRVLPAVNPKEKWAH